MAAPNDRNTSPGGGHSRVSDLSTVRFAIRASAARDRAAVALDRLLADEYAGDGYRPYIFTWPDGAQLLVSLYDVPGEPTRVEVAVRESAGDVWSPPARPDDEA